ncbi:hypothetical protein CHLRE_17g730000v5 [Chlamydomonas reinhardtii]|uniref:Uncharacterized protein n=1 Tax=Chlamydomonas reinhardtii TaxID=3055 RepID=A0A2K3CQW2_CHLRE|nr:uncharacterized protein CHLRE_17g730000v5 [Chlamydomonas reinhardtii]PNW70678.1 hypothetical protein CHLRE_17g730000v5 [Chlamydomonas reinhardtii]
MIHSATNSQVRGLRAYGVRAAARPAVVVRRRPCKPVCFKDKDSIDDTTTAAPGSTKSPSSSVPTPGAIPSARPLDTTGTRPVNLGPVASTLYPALQYATIAAAAAAIIAPGPTGSALFRGAAMTPTNRALLVWAAAALIPSIISKRQIKKAADLGILGSPAFKQLVSGCLLSGVLSLVVLTQAISLRNPILTCTVGTLAGVATLTTAYTLVKIRESGQLLPSARGLLAGTLDLLTPRTATAAGYSLLSAATAVAGVALFTSDPSAACPVFYQTKDAIHVFGSRIAGALTLGAAVSLFTIKHAADDGRQGSPMYKQLNGAAAAWAGLTAGVVGYSMATGLAMRNPMTLGVLAFYIITAAFTGYNWATAPKTA